MFIRNIIFEKVLFPFKEEIIVVHFEVEIYVIKRKKERNKRERERDQRRTLASLFYHSDILSTSALSVQTRVHYRPRNRERRDPLFTGLFLRRHRSVSHGAFIFLYFSSRVSHKEPDDRIRRVSMYKAVRVIR